ncbi:MAG: L-threonylcarbamoyladenylate synthase [Anaerolineae bacterium]|nr:L-threonylcarbamoyladenylate synthase [Anaerolineae bacterium]
MGAPIIPIRSSEALSRALAHLSAGELVVVPTDTIYGIAAHQDCSGVIARLYEARRRAPEPALPFLLSGADKMVDLVRPNATATRLARRFWPGPLSLILPPAAALSPEFRAYPIAVRVPNFTPLLELLALAGGSLMVSGAILPGYPPAITAQEAAVLFGDTTALILDGGPTLYGVPSTIVDCIPEVPMIVRRGILSEEKIRHTLDGIRVDTESP